MEPVSAFCVYSQKRKHTEQLLNKERKKQKKMDSNRKQKDVKQTNVKHRIQYKEKSKSTKKSNNKALLINKMNNIRNKRKKLKLNAMKKKSKNNANNRKTVQMTDAVLTKNIKNSKDSLNDTNSSQASHSTNTSIEINEAIDADPIKHSLEIFHWLLHPISIDTFFEQYWEKNPVHVKRDHSDYHKFIATTPILDEVLRKNHIRFTENIDITSYFNGVRETHNPFGRALPSIVWDYYLHDCSVRMLNPQTYIPKLHALNATLQEFFGCFVGANSYLTPPNSQGFAPHYDDVETFILQIEGKKRWKIYKPLSDNEYLPRYSSKNFDQSEIGEPILETVVKAGDLLYLPRGTIHQGMTFDDTHSLHVTLSVYQRNSWCDFLEKLLPQALKTATQNDVRFRQGLPLNYLKYVGTACNASDRKNDFKNDVKNLITLLLEYIDVDNAADLMAKSHMHDFLPPFIFKGERKRTVEGDGELMINNGHVVNYSQFNPETRIRLLRLHCMRLIKEEDGYKIYYSTENSKQYHEYEPHFLELDEMFVPAIKKMIQSYPDFISVKELPIEHDSTVENVSIESDDAKVQLVKDLWEKSLIITEHPLC